MWDQYDIFILVCFAALAVALSHQVIGNGIYLIIKHWRESLFLILCALVGSTFAIKKDAIGHEVSHFYVRLQEPGSGNIAAKIDHCKAFVSASLDGEKTVPPAPAKNLPFMAAPNPWESCARTFGMNYWKYDIAINGRNGGQLLCDAYQKQNHSSPSGKVRAWCETVFSTGQKI